MAPYYYSEELFLMIAGLLGSIPSALFGIAAYVLTALAVYTIALRRGLRNPWLAWVPVVNCWLLGSISDQYRYVARGEIRSKRKWLLGLSILNTILTAAMTVLVIGTVGTAVFGSHRNLQVVIGPMLSLLGLCLPLAAAAIARSVIRYMALYDVYKSMDPDNCVMFLVLSIVFGITEPFFLFFNRNKDKGMPPRKHAPVQEPPQPVAEAPTPVWEQNPDTTNYL